MALLPRKFRFWLFDTLSVKTMRYLKSVPRSKAGGLVAEVYDMIDEDFFVNGSLTSRSAVPELLAAIWSGGRETVLVSDELDRTTKEALTSTLSSINDCPYCGDMMISLVHAGGRHDDARLILNENEEAIADPEMRERLLWVRAVATPGAAAPVSVPFTRQQLPEAIGSLMALSDINRFSHVVMDGSPVQAPFGIDKIKAFALRIFGGELRATHKAPLKPGRTLHMLPKARLPQDMHWAKDHPRIARTLAQWTATVERYAKGAVPDDVQRLVHGSLSDWHNEQMPMSRSWVEEEIAGLEGNSRKIARLALVLAKSQYHTDDKMVQAVFDIAGSREKFLRILAWSSFTAARYFASHVARQCQQLTTIKQVA